MNLVSALSAVFLLTAAALSAQGPMAPPATAVMVNLTVKSDTDRAELMKVMPQEVRDTMQLYLEGKIQQWYSRGDGRGVIFFLNCKTVDEAKAIMGTLPLSKTGFANFEYTAVGPLMPMRMLLAQPAGGPGATK